jgi:hypothetical protein
VYLTSPEDYDAELERMNTAMMAENQALQHDNKQLNTLIKEYETTLETVMSLFRQRAVRFLLSPFILYQVLPSVEISHYHFSWALCQVESMRILISFAFLVSMMSNLKNSPAFANTNLASSSARRNPKLRS